MWRMGIGWGRRADFSPHGLSVMMLWRTEVRAPLRDDFGAEEVGDHFGVGLDLGCFHDLAGEEVEQSLVAGLNFGDFVGILGDDFLAEFIEGSDVCGLEAEFISDGCGSFVGLFEHDDENLAGLVGGEGAVFDEFEQAGEALGRHGAVLDGDAALVDGAEDVVDEEVCGFFRWNGGMQGGLEVAGELEVGRKHAGIVAGEREVVFVASLALVGALWDDLAHAFD